MDQSEAARQVCCMEAVCENCEAHTKYLVFL